MAIIKSNQGRIYFLPPAGTPAAQIKGTYADTYVVTSANKAEFEGFFTSYDTIYFGNLTISDGLGTINIPHKKTIVCNGRFSFVRNVAASYRTMIVVGYNTVGFISSVISFLVHSISNLQLSGDIFPSLISFNTC